MTPTELVDSLLALPKETEWVEFKHNNDEPQAVGEYLSALSNSAALLGRDEGYLLWGIEDGTHRVVGTTVDPRRRKHGNEEVENWLAHLLSPRVSFTFQEVAHPAGRVLLLRVQPAVGQPVAFNGKKYIRIGGIKKNLNEHPGKEGELWRVLDRRPFETGVCADSLTGDRVLALLDHQKYAELTGLVLPAPRVLLERLGHDRLIERHGPDTFAVTNLGAILFARNLDDFATLKRKMLRIIRYQGKGRLETQREDRESKGYASGLDDALRFIDAQVQRTETLVGARRHETGMYPQRALREVLINALLHQDFWITGTGPMVEIFDDRIEITNPGLPLIDPLRFIDQSPRARNEQMADLMRRCQLCEERGSGFDKAVADVERVHFPAPDIRVDPTHTKVILFAEQPLSKLDRRARIRACYQHCCLLAVSHQTMTNTTLRERFGLGDAKRPAVSEIIRDTLKAGLIRRDDVEPLSRKHANYVPHWA